MDYPLACSCVFDRAPLYNLDLVIYVLGTAIKPRLDICPAVLVDSRGTSELFWKIRGRGSRL